MLLMNETFDILTQEKTVTGKNEPYLNQLQQHTATSAPIHKCCVILQPLVSI